MLRLYTYDNCNEYKDFPNDLFKREDIIDCIDHGNDKVVIETKAYRLSSLMHLSGSGSNANSLEVTQFQGLKNTIKKGVLNLFNCQ